MSRFKVDSRLILKKRGDKSSAMKQTVQLQRWHFDASIRIIPILLLVLSKFLHGLPFRQLVCTLILRPIAQEVHGTLAWCRLQDIQAARGR